MDKKLSDEEILKLVEEFEKLSDETREGQLRLDRGKFKSAYNVPGQPDYVLKKALHGKQDDLLLDYIQHKQMGKHVPVEQPMLINRPGKEPILLQKKLNMKESALRNKEAGRMFGELYEKGISEADLHGGNVGLDESGKPKILDVGPFRSKDLDETDKLMHTRATALKRLKDGTKSRIFRALPFVGPALGAMAALDTEEASAAIPILGEAESVGESPMEEAEMLTEDKARKDYDKSSAKMDRLKKLLDR